MIFRTMYTPCILIAGGRKHIAPKNVTAVSEKPETVKTLNMGVGVLRTKEKKICPLTTKNHPLKIEYTLLSSVINSPDSFSYFLFSLFIVLVPLSVKGGVGPSVFNGHGGGIMCLSPCHYPIAGFLSSIHLCIWIYIDSPLHSVSSHGFIFLGQLRGLNIFKPNFTFLLY